MKKPVELDLSLIEKGREAARKATDAETEAALVHATEFLDTLPWKGAKASPAQKLAWPRVGVVGKDGRLVVGVPPEIKEATYHVAGFILAKVPFDVPAVAIVFAVVGHLLDESSDMLNRKVTWH